MTKIKEIGIKKVKFGKNVTIVNPVNLYECEIGDNSFIGPFVEIQKGVKIGKNCRIQSHTFICEKVKIDDNCFIGHGVNFINDKFYKNKLIKNSKKFLKNKIGKNVKLGSNSTILPVEINDNVVIGAGSVVTKNCNKNKVYFEIQQREKQI